MKLNIGGGFKRFDGFLNVDMDPNTNPDYVLNIEQDRWPFDDNSVSEVKAHHILEHLGDGFFVVIQELYRVCEDGAMIDIIVPHHRHDIFLADPTHKRPILTEGLRLFSKKFNQETVDTSGSSSCLGMWYNVDFEIISSSFTLDPFYEEYVKNTDREVVIEKERSCNNFIQETIIKWMVIK